MFLAVSGGADSTALLYLAAEWQKVQDRAPAIHVLTVDHGLRPEARKEAQAVVETAVDLGLPADILRWRDDKPKTGVQAAARDARYGLMLAHIRRTAGNPADAALITAHHRDDLAETMLMRLARGAGVDGLSAIQPRTYRDGVAILRPLLGVPKSRLRASLEAAAMTWIEDPSNADPQFERVQLRATLSEGAAQLGLDSTHLALTAGRMTRARRALEGLVDSWLRPHLSTTALLRAGVFLWPAPPVAMCDETAIRALMRILPAIGGGTAPIRLMRVERLWDDMQHNGFAGATLGNCIVGPPKSGAIAIYREPNRQPLPTIKCDLGRPLTWDNRFDITIGSVAGPDPAQFRVRPLQRDDLLQFDVDLSANALPCPLEALYATPVIDDQNGLRAIPALNMHRSGSTTATMASWTCRFKAERLQRNDFGEPGSAGRAVS